MRSLAHRSLAPLVLAVLAAGCSSSTGIVAPFVIPDHAAYVLTSDFASGSLSVIDLDTRQVTSNVAAVHSDATLRVYGGLIYVVNRFGQDNIQIIDPSAGFRTRRQYSTGNGSNPQDIEFASAFKAYISRYGSADLLVVDPRSGLQLKTISLAAFADADGLPEMAGMALVGPWLFVACQRLSNFAPVNASVVVVIATRTDMLVDVDPVTPGVQAIALTGGNPFTDFVYDASAQELLIGCPGVYGAADGGIERIDVQAMRSLGFAITETALGGDILEIAWNGAGHSYAIVSGVSFDASLVAWSAASGDTLRTVYAPGGFHLPDCEVNDRGELYVCVNGFTAPGVRVFHAGPDTLLAGPLDAGLPPSQIAFR